MFFSAILLLAACLLLNGCGGRNPSAGESVHRIKEEVVQDYTVYGIIIKSLNLTDNMRIALECRQNGLSYPEIGRVLSRAQATVYEYFIKMRQRYTAIYG